VKAAAAAQPRVGAMGLQDRERMNTIIRRICHDNADELARIELAETKIGRADHKAAKLRNIRYVLGAGAMRSDASSDAPGCASSSTRPGA
jgi:aldehyde dehydrogenase